MNKSKKPKKTRVKKLRKEMHNNNRVPIYCGNNALDSSLIDGSKVIGSRYACFKKGVGVGLYMPTDQSFLLPYAQIVPEKIYCGKSNVCPDGYDRLGSLHGCMQKGFGLGRTLKAKKTQARLQTQAPPSRAIQSKRR